MPFAAVGAAEMLEIVLDTDAPLMVALVQAREKTIGWKMQPLVRGVA